MSVTRHSTTTATESLEKLGVAAMRRGSDPGYEMGREIVPIGAMAWSENDELSSLKWKIYFSLRGEWRVKVVKVANLWYSPGSVDGVELTETETVFPAEYHRARVPFLFIRSRDGWTVDDFANVTNSTLRLETRRSYIRPNADVVSMNYLFKAEDFSLVQEKEIVIGVVTWTYRWAVPTQVPGRLRRMWGIPNYGTKTEPKVLLDYTKVAYQSWSPDWRIARDQFQVKTFFRFDGDERELPGAASSEDEWGFLPGGGMYEDFHSMPPVCIDEDLYAVPLFNWDPGFDNVTPNRTNYKHVAGGRPDFVGCRVCPTPSFPWDRTVRIMGQTVYDYTQLPAGAVVRPLLCWVVPRDGIPWLMSTIQSNGTAVVTMDDGVNMLSAKDEAFSIVVPVEVCDGGDMGSFRPN